jgi:hypothetical protein
MFSNFNTVIVYLSNIFKTKSTSSTAYAVILVYKFGNCKAETLNVLYQTFNLLHQFCEPMGRKNFGSSNLFPILYFQISFATGSVSFKDSVHFGHQKFGITVEYVQLPWVN